MNITVLDAGTLGADLSLDALNAFGDVTVYQSTAPVETAQRISTADVVVVNKVRLTTDVLAAATRLKLICVAATGYDNIDTEYCKENGIALCNVAGYSVNSVSQLTVAMVLSASVNLPSFRDSVASGKYSAGKSGVLKSWVVCSLST